jgi:16S rRNA (adenine1518-N6/adenine1519-N6)-dimethyltransferase
MSESKRFHDQGVKAKKQLGQHFLKDPSISQRIAGLIPDFPETQTLEVGPGTGALTRPLIDRFGPQVHVVEIDRESVAFLRNSNWMDSQRVHDADLLRSTPDELGMTGRFALVGNFPYNISSQILFRALDWKDQVHTCVGMFQKEVAERVCAPHGSKTYGILSVLLQTYYQCEYCFTVGPGAFIPPPKVDSGVIRMIRTQESDPEGLDYNTLRHVVKAAFGLRRKTLRNALRAGGYAPETIPESWRSKRAEQLSPSEFVEMTRVIQRIS